MFLSIRSKKNASKEEAYKIPSYLSREDKKKVQKLIKEAKIHEGVPTSTQDTIPLDKMFHDGIAKCDGNLYTRTVSFEDISYTLADDEDQTTIFDEWCKCLNYFDSAVTVQMTFVNTATDTSKFEDQIAMPHKNDGYDDVRDEYTQMLRQRVREGNGGLTKQKFITLGVRSRSVKDARPRLKRMETDLQAGLMRVGSRMSELDGMERLELLHKIFHIGDPSKFYFDWKVQHDAGLSVRDFIAPSSFTFKEPKSCMIGGLYCTVSMLQLTASELSDRMLNDLLKMDSSQVITLFIQSIEHNDAIKRVKRIVTELDSRTIDENKKAWNGNYSQDIMPSDLLNSSNDAKSLLKDLQSQNERLFNLTFLILNTGNTKQEMENNFQQSNAIAQKYNCNLLRLDYQQEQGLMSCLPLGFRQIGMTRMLPTSGMGAIIPFTTQELYQPGDGALYYGLNALTHNLIMLDRKKLKTPNGLILGTPGSGKSFSAKREIANAFLVTNDDIIISDPEGEYSPLVSRLGGQVIKIAEASQQYINPMDINENYSDGEDPIRLKADFVLSMCEMIIGGKTGLDAQHMSVLDRCVQIIYKRYFADPKPENMPILGDLYDELLKDGSKQAKNLAMSLEIYVSGSLNLFNHRTNVDINNRIVCFDIKELGNQLKPFGMLVVQDQVWGRVTKNRNLGRNTRYYMDEMHLLLRDEQTAHYMFEIWKRFRKWGGIPTGITQNVKDLLESSQAQNIIDNSDFIYLLSQAQGDAQILADMLGISAQELAYVKHSGEGQGLLFYDKTIVPFVDKFPHDMELYRIMTTKLSELVPEKEADGNEENR